MDATGWDERYRSTDRLWSATPNTFVENRLADHAPGVGLDLASGEGRNAIWLAERGWEMTAVDFSEVAIERGREHSDDVRFVVADVLTWEPDRVFDLIVVVYLQLVASDLERLIRRVTTSLASGGELFMVGHDLSNLAHGVGGPPYPEVLWDVDRIVSWLEGLEVLESGVVARTVEGEDRPALDALVRGRAPRAS